MTERKRRRESERERERERERETVAEALRSELEFDGVQDRRDEVI